MSDQTIISYLRAKSRTNKDLSVRIACHAIADAIQRGDHERTCMTCGRTFSTPQGLGQHFAWARRGRWCR